MEGKVCVFLFVWLVGVFLVLVFFFFPIKQSSTILNGCECCHSCDTSMVKKLFALPSGGSSPALSYSHKQPLKHNSLCSTAVQESIETCCFVSDIYRTTMDGWYFQWELLVQPSLVLCCRRANWSIISALQMSLPGMMFFTLQTFQSLPNSRYALLYLHCFGTQFAVSLLAQPPQRRHAEHLLILLSS